MAQVTSFKDVLRFNGKWNTPRLSVGRNGIKIVSLTLQYTHWLFIESEGNPSTDPVVAWYNGGPGASSMFGAFVELGPLLLNDESLQVA